MDNRINAAIELVMDYGGIDGSHHKEWVIDQVLRTLMGPEDYEKFREECEEAGYDWPEGIIP